MRGVTLIPTGHRRTPLSRPPPDGFLLPLLSLATGRRSPLLSAPGSPRAEPRNSSALWCTQSLFTKGRIQGTTLESQKTGIFGDLTHFVGTAGKILGEFLRVKRESRERPRNVSYSRGP